MTKNDLETLRMLKNSPLGDLFMKTLSDLLSEYTQSCRHQDGNALYRAQGKAQAIEDLIEQVTTAHDQIQRLR